MKSLRILIEEEPTLRYFFLIDGLDEFSGDKSELIDLVGTLSSHQNVKICVSSRPWVVFEDAYNQKPSLVMENITSPDIKLYITSKFDASPAFVEMKEVYLDYCDKLVENLIKKASGVFLWVVLTVRSLLESFSNGDRPEDIHDRLALVPPDLEGLFRKILDSIEPRYFKHASQLFQVFAAAKKPPTILCMAFTDQSIEQAMAAKVKPLTGSEIRYMARTMKRRINSRCKGLLEVGYFADEESDSDSLDDFTDGAHRSSIDGECSEDVEKLSEDDGWASEEESLASKDEELTPAQLDVLADTKVQYLHRTVKDYLEQPQIWSEITAATDPGFHPLIALYASHLLQLKSLDPDTMNKARLWDLLTWAIEYAASAEQLLSHSDYVAYVNAIDQVANQLCARPLLHRSTFTYRNARRMRDGKIHTYMHWTCTVPSRKRKANTTFLSVAVWSGLSSYLATKLPSYNSDDRSWPLLLSAVMDYDLFYLLRYTDRPHCAHSEPNPELVKLLLQSGADPNAAPSIEGREVSYSTSPWKAVQKHRPDESSSWGQIHKLFLEHGANVDYKVMPTVKPKKDIDAADDSRWGGKFGWSNLKKLAKTRDWQSFDH